MIFYSTPSRSGISDKPDMAPLVAGLTFRWSSEFTERPRHNDTALAAAAADGEPDFRLPGDGSSKSAAAASNDGSVATTTATTAAFAATFSLAPQHADVVTCQPPATSRHASDGYGCYWRF